MLSTLTGNYTKWTMFDHERTYGTVQNLPYSEAAELMMAVRYNGQTGKGSQRELVDGHVRKLKKEIEQGRFTPTPVSASCTKKQIDSLVLNPDGTFSLQVDSENPLHQSDGGHRFEAIGRVIKDLRKQLESADNSDQANLSRWLNQAQSLPVTVTLYFDGEPAEDFVRLQLGRPVDASHLLSLSVQQKLLADPAVKMGFDVARALQKKDESPFKSFIRFDSRGKLPLPINSLCSRGASDIATSLVGLSRVWIAHDKKNIDMLAELVCKSYQALREADRLMADSGEIGILDYGKVLTPIANEGKRGQATMLIGLATCLAYRLASTGRAEPTDQDLSLLIECASNHLNKTVNGNLSGPTKRSLLGDFAKDFFLDLDEGKHKGIPVFLLKTLSASTFGVPPIPKEPKKKKSKKKEEVVAKEATTETVEDHDVPWEDPAAVEVLTADAAPWESEAVGVEVDG